MTAVDLAVVGGGSAGFAAAIRAADLGASVAIIEAGTLGGTCVNVGCVPSKTLLRAAEAHHRARQRVFDGVVTQAEPVDFATVMAEKDGLVAELQRSKYVDVLASYPSISLIRGRARFAASGELEVDGVRLSVGKVILATGSRPWAPPIAGLTERRYLTSTEALSLRQLPASLAVIGGGAVGLEIAQLYARLGTRVTVLEARDTLVPEEDPDLGAALAGYLASEGLRIHTGAVVERVDGDVGAYRIATRVGAEPVTIEAEQLLVATGRRANTHALGLAEAGIRTGARGEIVIDDHGETTRSGVYAAGDATGEPMFVYVAAHAGAVAADNALRGNQRSLDLALVPRVTFTDPAIASVGITAAAGGARGLDVIEARLSMTQVPRAIAARDTRGLIKLVAERQSKRLLGAHVLAPEAGEVIQEVVLAIRFGISADELGAMLHPYLTNAEGIKLAAQTFTKSVSKLSCCAA